MCSITIGSQQNINWAIDIKNKKFKQFTNIIRKINSPALSLSMALDRANRQRNTDVTLEQIKEKLLELILLLDNEKRSGFWISNAVTSPTDLLSNQLPETGCKNHLECVTEKLLRDIYIHYFPEFI